MVLRHSWHGSRALRDATAIKHYGIPSISYSQSLVAMLRLEDFLACVAGSWSPEQGLFRTRDSLRVLKASVLVVKMSRIGLSWNQLEVNLLQYQKGSDLHS